MTELEASRTLVKSPPELWAECSDAASLARHLGQFGEIRITRLDPETAVAWEGEHARGTVRIEPSGWGTKVILTAVALSDQPPPAQEPPQAPVESASADPPLADRPSADPPSADPPPALNAESPPPRRRRFARLFARRRPAEPPAEPVAVDPPEPDPDPAAEAVTAEPVASNDTEAALTAALDSLGQAHHRPYSRA
jgi:hypothetical protein